MNKIDTLTSWLEWSITPPWKLSKTEPWLICESCEGEGYHGYEEESGNPYICFRCYGTGKYHLTSEAL